MLRPVGSSARVLLTNACFLVGGWIINR
jgi:hypothetical protein